MLVTDCLQGFKEQKIWIHFWIAFYFTDPLVCLYSS